MEITVDGKTKKIEITRAHLEADAGKSTHPVGADYSLVDLNRAGTPLLEIVSEPDMHSAAEARAYAQELYLSMKHADVSDVDLYHGNMRFDVNVSVSKDPKVLGTRSETKNLNSFRSVEKAVEYEINRQIALLEKGDEVVQETRGWNDDTLSTFSQRSKEDAHDYRYFPDPDLPPVVLENKEIEKVRLSMPKMPAGYRQEFTRVGLDESQIATVLLEPQVASYISSFIEEYGSKSAKTVVNWFTSAVTKMISDNQTSWQKILKLDWPGLAQLVLDDKISSTSAKQIILLMLEREESAEKIAKDNALLQISDSGALEKIVEEVLAQNPEPAADIKKGEMKAIGFLVGQVMKLSKGQANPAMAQKLIKEKLGV